MKDFSSRVTARLRHSRRMGVGLVLLPAACLLLFGWPARTTLRPAAALAQGVPSAPDPQFPTTPTPAGNVSLQDLHFPPLAFSGWPTLLSRLKVSYRDGTVTITDVGRNAMFVSSGETFGARRGVPVWSGPVSAASFAQETVGGVNTLKDGNGKVLWSDAADTAAPDLLFVKTPDGEARLTSKAGVTLWAGRLPGIRSYGVSSRRQDDNLSIVAPSICIEGAGGVFRVTSGKLLWSGYLPPSPLIVIRDGNMFMVEGPGWGDSGTDQTRRVSMTAGFETVTVADTDGRVLGTRTVDALTLLHAYEASFMPRGNHWPADYKSQDGRLDAAGTLLLTYRDSAGRVVRRSKIYKDARGDNGTFN